MNTIVSEYPQGFLEVYRSRSLRRSERWRWRFLHHNTDNVAQSPGGYYDADEALRLGRKVIEGGYAKPEPGIDVDIDITAP